MQAGDKCEDCEKEGRDGKMVKRQRGQVWRLECDLRPYEHGSVILNPEAIQSGTH